jgi:hypothetical protein
MAHDVFISYAADDKPIADAVCATLENSGIRCWVAPRDVLAGENWGRAIVEAIHSSNVMVVVFSSHSNQSLPVMREVERGVNLELPIVPFRIEAVLPSQDMEYFLSSTHWLDAMTPPMEHHLKDLVSTVKLLLDRKQRQSIETTSAAPRPAAPVAPPAEPPPAPPEPVTAPLPKTAAPLPMTVRTPPPPRPPFGPPPLQMAGSPIQMPVALPGGLPSPALPRVQTLQRAAGPSRLARASLVVGILGLLLIPVMSPLGPVAWILGNAELKNIRKGLAPEAGIPSARAGVILGIAGTLLFILYWIFVGPSMV